MPVSYAVLPHRNLIRFTYHGEVTFAETTEIVARAARDPAAQPGMRHLCDVAAVTGVERDFAALMRMQARIAEDLVTPAEPLLVVFHAPTAAGQAMAAMARRSWDGLDSVRVLVAEDAERALDILGLPAADVAVFAGAP